MKKTISILLLCVLMCGCISTEQQQVSVTPTTLPKCGDGICEADEDCNTCPQDCGCKTGEFCDKNSGVCKKDVCGNGICTEEKKTTCCRDCGCTENNMICNKYTNQCINRVESNQKNVESSITTYLSDKNITAEIVHITDTYYKDNAIKEVLLNCSTNESKLSCGIVLFLNESLDVVEEYNTL